MEQGFRLEPDEGVEALRVICLCGHIRWDHDAATYNCQYTETCPCTQFETVDGPA